MICPKVTFWPIIIVGFDTWFTLVSRRQQRHLESGGELWSVNMVNNAQQQNDVYYCLFIDAILQLLHTLITVSNIVVK